MISVMKIILDFFLSQTELVVFTDLEENKQDHDNENHDSERTLDPIFSAHFLVLP